MNGFDQDGFKKDGFHFHRYYRNGYNLEGFKRNKQLTDDEGNVKLSFMVNLCNVFNAMKEKKGSDEIMKQCVGLNPNTFKMLLKG